MILITRTSLTHKQRDRTAGPPNTSCTYQSHFPRLSMPMRILFCCSLSAPFFLQSLLDPMAGGKACIAEKGTSCDSLLSNNALGSVLWLEEAAPLAPRPFFDAFSSALPSEMACFIEWEIAIFALMARWSSAFWSGANIHWNVRKNRVSKVDPSSLPDVCSFHL